MKIKRFTKLALAGVGLAATAATLTTSTYAWYVTNSEVTATGVSGQVASAGAGSLYISKNLYDESTSKYGPNSYQFDIELNAATKTGDVWDETALNAGDFKFDDLSPQSKAKTERYAKAALGVTSETGDAAEELRATTYNATLKSTTVFVLNTDKYVYATGAFDSHKDYYKFTAITGTDYKADAAAAVEAGTFTDEAAYFAANPLFEHTAAVENPAADEYYTASAVTYDNIVSATTYYVAEKQTINQYYASTTSTTYFKDKELNTYATGVYNKRNSYYDDETKINIGDWVDAEGNAVTGKFVTFGFWLRAEDGGNVNVYVNVDNTTQVQKDQKVQNRNGAGEQAIGSNLYVDAVQALRMSIKQQDGLEEVTSYKKPTAQPTAENFDEGTYYTNTGTAQAPVYTVANAFDQATAAEEGYYISYISNVTEKDYQLDQISNYDSDASTATAGGINFTNVTNAKYDAGVYYKNVVGKVAENTTAGTGVSVDDNTGLTAWNSVTLKAATDTYFEFKIWLEGSDRQCFDSCRGQTFTVDFRFEL